MSAGHSCVQQDGACSRCPGCVPLRVALVRLPAVVCHHCDGGSAVTAAVLWDRGQPA